MNAGPLLALALAAFTTTKLPAGDHQRSLTSEGLPRAYWVHIPPGYDASKPTPVVLILHSALMNGPSMAKFCGMNDKADQAGFIAVYPNGAGPTSLFKYWDAGGVKFRDSDDVGFIAKVLDDLESVVHVDRKRVFAAGMSNGGMMCYRLAAELSNRIAAIASVAGSMAINDCHPKRPVPVLHFHGTKDGVVLYNGPDERTPSNIKFLSVDDTVRAWARLDGCPPTPSIDVLPHLKDQIPIRRAIYGPGTDGAEVVLYSVQGGGHTWPGRDPEMFFLGKSTKDVSANDLIWEFFQKHPMK
ncbi:alpha/beta hydrolase family esterase [Paludisphaera borealis]|uniref:CE1 family carbohydrate esterase n=1 Tax=Paludisphaera borealis TaxID=1387353 RepID=A0A1U7CKG6_9BACT|nr:PHB depolymerase family esterase [Paludisphaera borealis]APW59434.1 CE1 family carbohydrate esterase [Paludisphaera borealis]